MKVFFFFIVLFFQLNAFSQNLAQKHLSQLPPLPSRYCSFSDAEDNTYNNQVTKVISNIERDVELLEKQLPTENQMTKNVAKKYGISESKLNSMKNSDDESDGEEIANQKMISDYGISMEEAKKLENMSDKEIEQWASSYSQRSTGAAKNKSLQSRNAETYASNAKINELENQFSTYVDKWSRMGLELERQEKLADADLKVALEKVKKGAPEPKYVGEACVNQKAIDEYFAKNEPPCYDAYCNRVNPLWIQHLNQKKADMPKMFDLLDQILTLKNNLLKEENGIKIQNSILTETAKLALVKEYANEMRSGGPATRATKE